MRHRRDGVRDESVRKRSRPRNPSPDDPSRALSLGAESLRIETVSKGARIRGRLQVGLEGWLHRPLGRGVAPSAVRLDGLRPEDHREAPPEHRLEVLRGDRRLARARPVPRGLPPVGPLGPPAEDRNRRHCHRLHRAVVARHPASREVPQELPRRRGESRRARPGSSTGRMASQAEPRRHSPGSAPAS